MKENETIQEVTMKQDFLRQLTKEMPEAESKKLFTLLSLKGIELFGPNSDGEEYHNLTEASEAVDGRFYVAAADREAAVETLENAGLAEYISENIKVMSEAESYLEHAEKEYYRKRKILMYETLVVILGALLFYLSRGLG